MEPISDIYPLTSLQIGDVQSYLSHAYLYFATTSNKFLVLVDNHSWRLSKYSTSTHIRELLVTKCRTSPFRNSRALIRSLSIRDHHNHVSNSFNGEDHDDDSRKSVYQWLSAINSIKWRETAFFSLVDLGNALHGFIVFEVLLNDVRGINYFNELQSDTTMAFEVRHMKKWEFNSIKQASNCISSWFSGTVPELQTLHRCLIILREKIPCTSRQEITVSSKDLLLHGSCHPDILSQDEFFDIRGCSGRACCSSSNQVKVEGENKASINNSEPPADEKDNEYESRQYEDILIKFCFTDRDLPFKLKEIITSDLRLLTLLEAGLPSWVIFLQSYPLFCKMYCPWMRPLARTLYVVISLITVMVGFYDLYKNVPLLKATASHLCGPLFNWIEEWDMISRIRYLGTMLFLQNFQKAVRWSMSIGRAMKTILLLLMQPLTGPLRGILEIFAPVVSLFHEAGLGLCNMALFVLMSVFSVIQDLLELFLLPFEIVYSYVITMVAAVKPIVESLYQVCLVPVQACVAAMRYGVSIVTDVYKVFEGFIVMIVKRIMELAQLARATKPTTHDVSFWQTLWKDLFSEVFRSLRSVIYGLVQFLTTCNRHRLSTSNQIRAYTAHIASCLPSRLFGRPCQYSPMLTECECHEESSEDRHPHSE